MTSSVRVLDDGGIIRDTYIGRHPVLDAPGVGQVTPRNAALHARMAEIERETAAGQRGWYAVCSHAESRVLRAPMYSVRRRFRPADGWQYRKVPEQVVRAGETMVVYTLMARWDPPAVALRPRRAE
jgi:hypothetical protein